MLERSKSVDQPFLLGTGIVAALLLRLTLSAGQWRFSAYLGAFVFAVVLIAISQLAAPRRLSLNWKAFAIGVLGGLALVLATAPWSTQTRLFSPFLLWAPVTALVAFGEELALRGALFDLLSKRLTAPLVVFITATVFAAIHYPIYGWVSLPLDFAAGLWLGWLRVATGKVAAPIAAHTVADLVMWWLV